MYVPGGQVFLKHVADPASALAEFAEAVQVICAEQKQVRETMTRTELVPCLER